VLSRRRSVLSPSSPSSRVLFLQPAQRRSSHSPPFPHARTGDIPASWRQPPQIGILREQREQSDSRRRFSRFALHTASRAGENLRCPEDAKALKMRNEYATNAWRQRHAMKTLRRCREIEEVFACLFCPFCPEASPSRPFLSFTVQSAVLAASEFLERVMAVQKPAASAAMAELRAQRECRRASLRRQRVMLRNRKERELYIYAASVCMLM